MGNDPSASDLAGKYEALAARETRLGELALIPGMKYASDIYKAGGYDQSSKFTGLTTDVLEGATGRGVDASSGVALESSLTGKGLATAEGLSGVAGQKVLSGLDEINKIRSVLSNQGIKTTAMGAQAAGSSIEALSLVPRNPALSTGLALAGGAAAAYGAYKDSQTPPPASTAAATSYAQQNPLFGTEQYYATVAQNTMPIYPVTSYFGAGK